MSECFDLGGAVVYVGNVVFNMLGFIGVAEVYLMGVL